MDNLLKNLETVNQLFKKKHFKKASNLLSNLKEKFPEEKKIDVLFAILYKETYEYKKSLIHISECIDSNIPKNFVENFTSELILKVLNLPIDLKEIQIYINILNNVIKKDLKNLQLIFYRSQFLFKLNRYKRAINDLEFCLENEKNKDKITSIKWNLSLIYLKIGLIKKGYELYESRFEVPFLKSNYEDYKNIYWQKNTNLAKKKIFIYFEQGYGDTIQYVRFLHDLIQKNAKVFFLCQKSLFSLIHNSFPEVTLVSDLSEEYDYIVPLLSLPKLLNLENLSQLSSTRYLKVDPNIGSNSNLKIDNKKINVGLCWRGNPNHQNDINRSFEIKYFQNILNDHRFVFHSLMNLHSDDELMFIKNYSNFIDHSKNLNDFNHTASLLISLDGIITVDTSIAHLAGALGVKTKLILPKTASDFRWLLRSSTSSWYESLKIYRRSSVKSLDDILKQTLLDFV